MIEVHSDQANPEPVSDNVRVLSGEIIIKDHDYEKGIRINLGNFVIEYVAITEPAYYDFDEGMVRMKTCIGDLVQHIENIHISQMKIPYFFMGRFKDGK